MCCQELMLKLVREHYPLPAPVGGEVEGDDSTPCQPRKRRRESAADQDLQVCLACCGTRTALLIIVGLVCLWCVRCLAAGACMDMTHVASCDKLAYRQRLLRAVVAITYCSTPC